MIDGPRKGNEKKAKTPSSLVAMGRKRGLQNTGEVIHERKRGNVRVKISGKNGSKEEKVLPLKTPSSPQST